MGEAKRRGSIEKRIAQATNAKILRQETPIDAIKEEFGLPSTAEYLGCVVHLPDTDEYLAVYDETTMVTRRGFVRTPENAIRYATRKEADDVVARLHKRAVSGVLFDTGDQYFVAFDS